MSNFVHLHSHSQASLLDAMTRPRELMERVSSIDQTAVACTDHGNSYAIAEMLKAAKKRDIKLISGCEFYVANLGLRDRSARDDYHLTVLCDGSKRGWKNLCNLHCVSFSEGYYYKNRIDLDVLSEHSEGLIALSGCMGGAALKAYLNDDEDEARRRILFLKQVFGPERFFIELQNHNLPGDAIALPWLRNVAKEYKLKTVATNDAHYCNKDDWKIHDALIAIGKNQCVFDPNRTIAYEPEMFYVKDYSEMAVMGFSKAELEQSAKIADMCSPLDLESKSFHIPKIKNAVSVLQERTRRGILSRYGKVTSEIQERVDYEIRVIESGGFCDYFLVVCDLYDSMRREKIPTGPGRGSVGGSIVAYAIGITEVDPLRYGLFFERFLNSERVSMPDIDLDVSAVHRERVIAYLREKYGNDKTAQLITFQSIGGRAAIRDVGRAFRLPLDKADLLAKSIPLEGSQTKDRESRAYLAAALSTQKVLRQAYDSDDLVKQVIDTGIRLEGVTKAASKHAAGIVISDVPLYNLVPMGIKTKGDDPDPNVVGFEMNYIEDMGLIKFDILGLRNVDVVADCIADMKAHKVIGKDFSPKDIPTDDAATFQMLCRGLTAGLFQIESSSMAGWLRKLQPDRIEDVMAMVALFRPGPMEFIPRYIERKHGREEVTYPHPSLEPVLRDTYGIPLYQEAVMSIGRVIAGWSLARADGLRKVIGKKIIDDIAKERKQFADDAAKNGYEWKWADGLFEKFIEPAANYSFNKCLTGDTVLLRSAGGRFCKQQVSIQELFNAQNSDTPVGRKLRDRNRGIKILQMDGDGHIRPGKLKKVCHSGLQRVWTVTTASGKSITATSNHRLLTDQGYAPVASLRVGEHNLMVMGANASDHSSNVIQSRTSRKKTISHFNDGRNNGQWVDGHSVIFRDSCDKVLIRSNNQCEGCGAKGDGSKHSLEFAHIESIDECNDHFKRYNSDHNLRRLCNSCHKAFDYQKGERVKRYTHGKLTASDPITSIIYAGIQDTFDIEMEAIGHNFVANEIVSHNSHACAYGLLAYQTAYLKCNYPTFYFAALLKSIEDHPKRDEKMAQYIADARQLGVAILPPDINISSFSFTAIPSEKCVRFGLNGIKHCGSRAVAEIIKKRDKGPFTDLFSTVERIKSTLVNSRCLESLVASGAMDSLGGTRAQNIASLEIAITRADNLQEDKKRIAAGGVGVKRKKAIPEPTLLDASMDKIEMLAKERELLGYYLSDHPWLDVTSTSSHTIQEAREEVNGTNISVGGIVSRRIEHTTKKSKQKMLFGAIEDDKAVLEFVVFPRQYEAVAQSLKLDSPVVLSGRIENDVSEESDGTAAAKIIISKVEPIARGLKKKAEPVIAQIITIPRTGYHEEIKRWRAIMDANPNDITDLKFILPDGSEIKVVK